MTKNSNEQFHADALTKQRNARSNERLKNTAMALAVATALGGAALPYLSFSSDQLIAARDYAEAVVKWNIAKASPFGVRQVPTMTITVNGRPYLYYVTQIAYAPGYQANAYGVLHHFELGGIGGFMLGIAGLGVAAIGRRRRREEVLRDRVVAGTIQVSEAELAKRTARVSDGRALSIGQVTIPNNLETRHMAVIGATGSGKSTVLRQMLDKIEARGDAALVYDTSGAFTAHYYNPARGDVILNPFDQRGCYWTPLTEIRHPADASRIAAQIVTTTGKAEDDVWLEATRNLVADIMRTLWQQGDGTLESMLQAIQSKTAGDLKTWLAHTSSARVFAEDAERATGSVLFMLARASNLLQFLRAEGSGSNPFAFRDYIEGLDNHTGARPWVFVPRREEYFEAMKPLLACWLECAASAVLSLEDDPKRRIWFILDELADLPKIPNLIRLLPEGRKYGAAVVLTFQAIGQMRDKYGVEGAEAMLGQCNTKLFLQLIDEKSRKWASDTIGTCEVEIQTMSDALAQGDDKPRTTLSTKREIRPAVMESALRLPPYQGYLLFPDALPLAKVKLTNEHIKARGNPRQRAFVEADIKTTLWGKAGLSALPAKPEPETSAPHTSTFDSGPV